MVLNKFTVCIGLFNSVHSYQKFKFNGVYSPFNNARLLVLASVTDISLFFLVCNYGNI